MEVSRLVVNSYKEQLSYTEKDIIYKLCFNLCGKEQTLIGFWAELLSRRMSIVELVNEIGLDNSALFKRILLFAEAELHTHAGKFEHQIAVIKNIKKEIKLLENRKRYGKL
jgi:hypothetical protein